MLLMFQVLLRKITDGESLEDSEIKSLTSWVGGEVPDDTELLS